MKAESKMAPFAMLALQAWNRSLWRTSAQMQLPRSSHPSKAPDLSDFWIIPENFFVSLFMLSTTYGLGCHLKKPDEWVRRYQAEPDCEQQKRHEWDDHRHGWRELFDSFGEFTEAHAGSTIKQAREGDRSEYDEQE